MTHSVRFCIVAMLALALGAVSVSAAPTGWTEDFAAAKAEAASSGKDLFLEFTGSDWCPPCKALNQEVFSTSAFLDTAPDSFVLVKLDFPSQIPQTLQLQQQNQDLAEAYNIQGYPTVILADAQGKPYAQTGYQPGGADSYLAHLEGLRSQRAVRDEALARAEVAEGVEKARALDQAMEAVGFEFALLHYPSAVENIIALDPENQAGLKDKYASALELMKMDQDMQSAIALLSSGEFEEGIVQLDRVIENHNPEGEPLQMVMAIKAQANLQLGRTEQAFELFEQAIAVDSDSQIAGEISAILSQIRPALDTQ